MNQSLFGLLLFIGLILPPVTFLMESIMIIHMHMQMPMLIISGFLMGCFFQKKFPRFFEKWNENGIPGLLLFCIIMLYWMIPRTMDEALVVQSVEFFKFISLPFLAGVPLRDSWMKLSSLQRNVTIASFTLFFIGMGFLYIKSPVQLCNNYLVIDQIILGWGFLTMAIPMIVYLGYVFLIDSSQYE
ncbi:hypothetical protein [Bacillus sp. 2205SS5-2]|uniref:hypothetical protein n=1 Tax=Bacillus sp. 2205SS5-2 TaxID=3109031 RepID=UPI0030069CB6